MGMSRLAWLNLAAKLALVALIALYLLNPEWEQFQRKVMPLRSIFFPVGAMLVPLAWWLRGQPRPYPHLVDTLVVAALLVDYGGNAANLYIHWWFDHTVHFTNMLFVSMAFGLLLAHLGLPRWALAGLALGFGAVLHTVWEIVEFTLAWVWDTELHVDALTTTRDFAAGLAGTSLAALLVYRYLWRRVDLGGRLLLGEQHIEETPARRAIERRG